MAQRERLFFGLTDMTAFTFAGLPILQLLIHTNRAEGLHGRALQQQFYDHVENTWTMSNHLLYAILHTYEKQGLLISKWDNRSSDKKKKSLRYYRITDEGASYLSLHKSVYLRKVTDLIKLWEISIDLFWGSDKEIGQKSNIPFSSTLFSKINILYFLKTCSDEKTFIYGRELKEKMHATYRGLWEPSDSMLYVTLSELDTAGYTESEWSTNEEETFDKKRTTREYRITERGIDSLHSLLKVESGIKRKLFDVKTLCEKTVSLFP